MSKTGNCNLDDLRLPIERAEWLLVIDYGIITLNERVAEKTTL